MNIEEIESKCWNLLSRIKDNNIVWEVDNAEMPDKLEFLIRFPNGKQGEIDMAIATAYGETTEIGNLNHLVSFDRQNLDKAELIVGYYYVNHVCTTVPIINFYTSSTDITENAEIRKVMGQVYNYYILAETIRDAGYSFDVTTAFRKSRQLLRKHFENVKEKRESLYEELVAKGSVNIKWKSERQVYALAKYLYPDAKYQYHCDWLGLQSLDVFIPSLDIAIEYQGIQHYEAVPFFGGENGFTDVQNRDKKKKKLCADHGVKLIEWKYTTEITQKEMEKKIKRILSSGQKVKN